MTLLSIIIVTYNSGGVIASCLKSLQSNKLPDAEFELLLIDNASTDNTRHVLQTQFPDVRFIENKKNVGFAVAVNQAAAAAKGKYLLFLNPDTAVQENFVQRLLEFFHGNPQAGIVGVNLVDEQGKHQPSCWKKPSLLTLKAEMLLPYKLSLGLVTDNPALRSEVKMVSGACMAMRRELFDRLHGFDEEYFMYYEDADLCFRARKAGFKIFFNPEISVLHHAGSSSTGTEAFYERFYKSKLLFFKKNYSRSYAFLAQVILLFGILVRIPVYYSAGAILFNKKLLRLAKIHTMMVGKVSGWVVSS